MKNIESMDVSAKTSVCARIAYEANRAYCSAMQDVVGKEWHDLAADEMMSYVRGVVGVLNGNSPAEQHAAWCADKKANNWVYGPVKDEHKREHPCLLPYDRLPASQRQKDVLFIGVVSAAAKTLGLPCWALR